MTQKERFLRILKMNPNKEISAWELVMKTRVLHYTEIIRLLRKDGYKIENRTQDIRKNGEYIKHSWYKLITDEKPTLKEKILFKIGL